MSSQSGGGGGGAGILTLLTVLFVGLKLAEVGVVSTWSWWLVLSPTLVPLLIFLLFSAAVALFTSVLSRK